MGVVQEHSIKRAIKFFWWASVFAFSYGNEAKEIVNNRNWVQWNQKNVLESTIDNKIMGKMSPSKVSHALERKKRHTQNIETCKQTAQKLILHRHSLFEYYRLNGFLREREKKIINIHLRWLFTCSFILHLWMVNSLAYNLFIFI